MIAAVAAKALRQIPKPIARTVMMRRRAIAADPFAHHANVKPLKGELNKYRLRVGDWRAIYRIDRGVMTVLRLDVLKRGEAYR